MITNGHSEILLTSFLLQCQVCLLGKQLAVHIKYPDPSKNHLGKLPTVFVFVFLFESNGYFLDTEDKSQILSKCYSFLSNSSFSSFNTSLEKARILIK